MCRSLAFPRFREGWERAQFPSAGDLRSALPGLGVCAGQLASSEPVLRRKPFSYPSRGVTRTLRGAETRPSDCGRVTGPRAKAIGYTPVLATPRRTTRSGRAPVAPSHKLRHRACITVSGGSEAPFPHHTGTGGGATVTVRFATRSVGMRPCRGARRMGAACHD